MTILRSRFNQVHSDNDDRGLISVVLIVIIVGMGLAAILTPLVLTQSRSTSQTDARVQALASAESGLNAMLGTLRNSQKTSLPGVSSQLPCLDQTPLAGVQPGSSTSIYSVTMGYYTSDPLTVLASTGKVPPALSCVSGSGPQLAGKVTVPSFAKIISIGKAGTGMHQVTRTLTSVYAFNTTNIFNSTATSGAGGQIRLDPRNVVDTPRCLFASSIPVTGATPVAGTVLNAVTCTDPTVVTTAKPNIFTYNTDLTLRLAQSVTAGLPYGLCVTSIDPTTTVSLQPCLSPALMNYTQQWRTDASGAIAQVRPGTNTRACLTVAVKVTAVTAGTCTAGYDLTDSWLPTPSVGAGAAGPAQGQLVNLSQFGRCAQVTNPNVSPSATADPFNILYPCQQLQSPAVVDWYQRFTFDTATGHWLVTKPGDASPYCLTSPGTAGYVTVTSCDATNTLQKWTDYGAAAANQANASQWDYAKRYTIVDSTGLCLALSPTADSGPAAKVTVKADWYSPPGTTLQFYSKLTAAACTSNDPTQKWNATPNTQSSTLRNTTEH